MISNPRSVLSHVAVSLLLMTAAPVAAGAQVAPTWAEDLLEAWYAAYNAGDVDGVARLYSDDAVWSAGVRGRAAIKADLTARFAKTRFECSGDFDGFQEIAGSAVAWGHDTCTETPKSGGPSKTTESRWLAVYERQPDGKWLTVRDIAESLTP